MIKITVNDKEYSLRLDARHCCQAEDRLGMNPLNILFEFNDHKVPSLKKLLIVLNEALDEQHHISMNNTYDLYDNWCKEGHTQMELLNTIIEVFRDGGFIPTKEGEEESKN